jgi:hypothetical protein
VQLIFQRRARTSSRFRWPRRVRPAGRTSLTEMLAVVAVVETFETASA